MAARMAVSRNDRARTNINLRLTRETITKNPEDGVSTRDDLGDDTIKCLGNTSQKWKSDVSVSVARAAVLWHRTKAVCVMDPPPNAESAFTSSQLYVKRN